MTITRDDGKHIHHDLIVEWAKDPTRIVQVLGIYDKVWRDCPGQPVWSPIISYRFKPEVVTISCRRCVMRTTNEKQRFIFINVYDPEEEKVCEANPGFIKWMGGRVNTMFEV